jgi:ABC-type lipoprotein release transport system permease subunit
LFPQLREHGLLFIAILAAMAPAIRASRIDPMRVLASD